MPIWGEKLLPSRKVGISDRMSGVNGLSIGNDPKPIPEAKKVALL
jgi:hypothetical protein